MRSLARIKKEAQLSLNLLIFFKARVEEIEGSAH